MSARGFLFDSNVWIALAFSAHPLHDAARGAFGASTNTSPIVFCRATQQSVLRLLTTERLAAAFGVPAMSNRDALALLERWMEFSSVVFQDEPASLFPRWRQLASLPSASPKRWMDAYLAAFAMQADLELVSADSVFVSFPGLRLKVLQVSNSA